MEWLSQIPAMRRSNESAARQRQKHLGFGDYDKDYGLPARLCNTSWLTAIQDFFWPPFPD